MSGFVYSLQSLGTVDGPGVRAVIFAAGCPLRCIYCHNPDTWKMADGVATEAAELVGRVTKFKNYIKNGGVTISGGEPLLQAEFFLEVVRLLHAEGIHVALDTSGCILDEGARELILECDLILLDVKFTSEEDYKRYTGGSLYTALRVLALSEEHSVPVWIRHVVVPGINDTVSDAVRLGELLRPFSTIERVELLPFKKLCLEKYEALGIDFPLADTPSAREADMEPLLSAVEGARLGK